MSLSSIRAALEVRLNTISPEIDTAWENVAYTPSKGVPFQRVYLMPAMPDNPVYGPGFHIEQGLLQVTLCYPLQAGPAAATARAELIRATFPRALSMTSGGVTVTVQATPEIGVSQLDEDVFALPVRIRWYANIST